MVLVVDLEGGVASLVSLRLVVETASEAVGMLEATGVMNIFRFMASYFILPNILWRRI